MYLYLYKLHIKNEEEYYQNKAEITMYAIKVNGKIANNKPIKIKIFKTIFFKITLLLTCQLNIFSKV